MKKKTENWTDEEELGKYTSNYKIIQCQETWIVDYPSYHMLIVHIMPMVRVFFCELCVNDLI